MAIYDVINTVIAASGTYTLSEEDMSWVLPIVGIVVVLAAQTLLAVILMQFKWLDPEWRKNRKIVPAMQDVPKPNVEPVKVDMEAVKAEEELAAVATAVMLYMQDETSYVNCTEILDEEVSPWTQKKSKTVFSTQWH